MAATVATDFAVLLVGGFVLTIAMTFVLRAIKLI